MTQYSENKDRTVLQRSIHGITREINLRDNRLRQRRYWYLDMIAYPTRSFMWHTDHSFTWYGFYFEGYKILQEVKKLRKIRDDIYSILES
jgi:hypothetical protein